MTAPDSVQFKVALNRPNQPAEIRRFTIEKDVVTNYGYLRQKLYTIFPVLQATGMTISWKDSEDDLVLIGSDEELIIALTEMEGVCKKLYVNSVTSGATHVPQGSGAPATRPENMPKVIHENVYCDGCQTSGNFISGYRYMCVVCPDFDLCFDCEQRGCHPEHTMIRYPFPVPRARDFHFVKKLKKLHKKFDHYHQLNTEPDFFGHDHRKSFRGSRGNRCPAMNDDVLELVEDFVSSLRSQVVEVTPDLIQQVIDNLSSMNLTGAQGPNPGEAQDTPSCSRKHGESSKKKDKEDRNSKKRGCPFTEQRPTGSAGPMSAAHPPLANLLSNVMQQVGAVAPHVVPNILSALNQMGAAVNTTGTSATGAGASASETSAGATTPGAAKSPGPATSAGGVPSAGATPSADATTSTSPPEPSAPVSEPMVITLDDIDDEKRAASPMAASHSAPAPIVSEFQQMIDRQLNSMLSMGFNNEGGWLRDMLVAKNGDITKVLDVLGGSTQKGSPLSRLELD